MRLRPVCNDGPTGFVVGTKRPDSAATFFNHPVRHILAIPCTGRTSRRFVRRVHRIAANRCVQACTPILLSIWHNFDYSAQFTIFHPLYTRTRLAHVCATLSAPPESAFVMVSSNRHDLLHDNCLNYNQIWHLFVLIICSIICHFVSIGQALRINNSEIVFQPE